jgi:hypothetical protein
MKSLWDSYKKPTPVRWRKIGDFALVMLPVIQVGLMGAPEGTFSPGQQYWIGFASSILIPAFKFWTNTRKEISLTTISNNGTVDAANQ